MKAFTLFTEANNSTQDRLTRYECRNDHIGSNNGIYEHLFCFTCKSKECNNSKHDHRELHPTLRIPKKNASKLKWKRFFSEYDRFGSDNIRHNRH